MIVKRDCSYKKTTKKLDDIPSGTLFTCQSSLDMEREINVYMKCVNKGSIVLLVSGLILSNVDLTIEVHPISEYNFTYRI